MIEGTALFFTLFSLSYFLKIKAGEYLRGAGSWFKFILFFLSLSLGLLVKVTTALPVLLVMGMVGLPGLLEWVKTRKNYALAIVYVLMASSFLILFMWTNHANELKSLNEFGSALTSTSLREWNFGTLAQRFSFGLWGKVFVFNTVGVLTFIPAFLLLVRSWMASTLNQKEFLVITLSLALAPILLFTNLHIVHDYYQVSVQVYFLMSLAASVEILSGLGNIGVMLKRLPVAVISLYFVSDLLMFGLFYSPWLSRNESPKLDVGQYIASNTSSSSAIVVFGDGWSSAIPYHSRRRALVRPYIDEKVLGDLSHYLGGTNLSAVISSKPLPADALMKSCSPYQELFFEDRIPFKGSLILRAKSLFPWLEVQMTRLVLDGMFTDANSVNVALFCDIFLASIWVICLE